ncbi:MAG: four helix bundle protein [Candidatus Cloacimonetes bacterium]|nr:four helix bundle protein [Candidatus Cloacimonadota bacterium]
MTNRSRSYKTNTLIPPHGGYRKLKSYQTAEIIYDLTVEFTKRYIKSMKLRDQMDGAARSGKQNIAEGSQVSGTSKKSEMKLVNVARGSLEELLQDYEDFLRQRGLPVWNKTDPRALAVRQLAYRSNRTYKTYKPFLAEPETAANAANCLICLIHQANFLLDQQLRSLEKEFLEQGGFTEKLYRRRENYRVRHRLGR